MPSWKSALLAVLVVVVILGSSAYALGYTIYFPSTNRQQQGSYGGTTSSTSTGNIFGIFCFYLCIGSPPPGGGGPPPSSSSSSSSSSSTSATSSSATSTTQQGYYGMNLCGEHSGCPMSVKCYAPSPDPIYTGSASWDKFDSCFLGAGKYFNLNPLWLKAEARVESGINSAVWNWYWPNMPCGETHSYGVLQATPDCVVDPQGNYWFGIYGWSKSNQYGYIPQGYGGHVWYVYGTNDSKLTLTYTQGVPSGWNGGEPDVPPGDFSNPPPSWVDFISENAQSTPAWENKWPWLTSNNGQAGFIIDVTQDSSDQNLWPLSVYNPAYAIWATAFIYREIMIPQLQVYHGSFLPASCEIVQQWYVLVAAYNSGTWGPSCNLSGNKQGYGYDYAILDQSGNANYFSWYGINGWLGYNPYLNFPNYDSSNPNPYYGNGCNENSSGC